MRPGFDYAHATLLQGTAALNCKGGIIGGAAGAAKDTEIVGVYIKANATAVTLTITGLEDSTGAQQPFILTGSTTVDTWVSFPAPLLNELAAFTFQPSVAALVWVFTRAFQGGTD